MTPPLKLELISRLPAAADTRPPLLFVHGAYSSAWVWDEFWLPWFAANGWSAHALSLEGHGDSDGHSWLAAIGIDDYVRNVAQIAATLPAPPVLIGHSMGGYVIQRYLEQGHPAAGVAMLASVPPPGMTHASLAMLWHTPDLLAAVQLFQSGPDYHPSLSKAKELLFSADMPDERLAQWLGRFQPESMRAVFDMMLVGILSLPPMHDRLPALVMGGADDRIIGSTDLLATATHFGVAAEILPGTGHMLMLDTRERAAAQRLLEWLHTRFG